MCYTTLTKEENEIKMKKMNLLISGAITTVVLLAVTFYVFLPPINPTTYTFWIWIWGCSIPLFLAVQAKDGQGKVKGVSKFLYAFYGLSVAGVAILSIISSAIFNANEYSQRIVFEETSFADVHEVDFSKTAIVDRDSTLVLGDRTLGQLPELISQFEVADNYSQISFKDEIVRVTPLDYNGIIKYFTNKADGIPAYITVNATTGKSELVKLESLGLDGMQYSVEAMFNYDRDRHIRFSYPTEIFGETNFEIDDEGIPYWITSTINYKGVNQKPAVSGVIVMNAINGEMVKYDAGSIPEWIDRVYPSELIIQEVDQAGSYIHGFWNSHFGQRDVYMTTSGYNYIELDDDIWLYTGITSVNSDESNIGFVLINQRTHEAKKIMSAGAEESSAMRSAEGKVQHLGYRSTFPLLISVSGRPTYLVSLKDDAGLVKMYAMIDCDDYQQVVTVDKSQGLDYLKAQYISSMNIIDVNTIEQLLIEIKEVSAVNIEGNTFYYLKDTEDKVYKVLVTTNEQLVPFLKVGDKVKVQSQPGVINIITQIESQE